MDAIEFVKKFGVGLTREIISDGILENYCRKLCKVISHHLVGFSFNDLKQIVDAFELVESFGGLFQAKVTLYKEGFTGGIECGDRLIEDDVLKQAIELVEKCNERSLYLEEIYK